MSEIFMISDTHFGDNGAILRYEGRPFKNGPEMDGTLIANWNRTVKKEDVVYHLGDVAWNMDKEALKALISGLNGRKILVMGNHDRNFTVREWIRALKRCTLFPLCWRAFSCFPMNRCM